MSIGKGLARPYRLKPTGLACRKGSNAGQCTPCQAPKVDRSSSAPGPKAEVVVAGTIPVWSEASSGRPTHEKWGSVINFRFSEISLDDGPKSLPYPSLS